MGRSTTLHRTVATAFVATVAAATLVLLLGHVRPAAAASFPLLPTSSPGVAQMQGQAPSSQGAAQAQAQTPAQTQAQAQTQAAEAGPHEALDRQTPRRTIQGLLKAGRDGDFRVAAAYLDLRGLAEPVRESQGPVLAQKLYYVLARQPTLEIARIPDAPAGDPGAPATDNFVAETLYANERAVPIALARVRFPDAIERWLVSRATVDAIPAIDAAYGPRPVGIPIPASLTRPMYFGNEPWQWIGVALAVLLSYGIARGAAALLVLAGRTFARRTPTRADDDFAESARRPLRMLVGAVTFRLLIDPLQLTTAVISVAEHVTYTLLVIGVAWLLVRSLGAVMTWLEEQGGLDGKDALRGRSVRTQASLLRRLASVTIIFVTGAFVLIQFQVVRSVGVSLLASAGVASVVVGLAAQKSLAAIIAGVQFSFAQPVRMGDSIVVEGEFGEVEEINLTYAVVRLWDGRRLVLPITYFLDKPFQNWTRGTTDLLGTVVLKVDFLIPVDAVREELKRACASDPLWDKRSCSLQVVDVDATSVSLRAVVSAADASRLWDLRCHVRERLLAFVGSLESGRFLVRARSAADGAGAATAAATGMPAAAAAPGKAEPSKKDPASRKEP